MEVDLFRRVLQGGDIRQDARDLGPQAADVPFAHSGGGGIISGLQAFVLSLVPASGFRVFGFQASEFYR